MAGMGDHFNSKHDDGTWRGLLERWHGGETARALRAEAGVSAEPLGGAKRSC